MQKKFSYPLKISELKQTKYTFNLSADKDELADIREILQVVDVKNFSAEIFLKFENRDNLLRVWGKVETDLILQSVISLKNFKQHINNSFELFYDTKATYKDIREMEAGINDDVPDIIENDEINLADIAIEQVALCMDDYPRAKGEKFDFSEYATIEPEEKNNPFAILQTLKK
ncbi:MAG: DUF177 domain-containing protein [Alphaproteobacteria bacterium]|nr:DUF177 domain-containing protein [Alphaproteobacteria bacterium]